MTTTIAGAGAWSLLSGLCVTFVLFYTAGAALRLARFNSQIASADKRYFTGLPSLLFDLTADPEERVDRSRDPGMQSVRLAYAEKMLAWRARHADSTLSRLKLTDQGPVRRTNDGQIRRGF